MVEKFAQKKPSCIAYDEKLQFYSNLVIEVRVEASAASLVEFLTLLTDVLYGACTHDLYTKLDV